MKHSNRLGALRGRCLASLLMMTLIAPAAAVEVTGTFSGWWDQPEQQNHGLIVVITGANSGIKTGAVYWAHYDDEGNPSWLLAQGDIVGDTIDATVYEVDGVSFGQPADPDANNVEPVGTMQIQFDDCNSGNVTYETINVIVGTGGFPISRLSNQPGAPCSGGIGDDVPPGTLPEEFDIDLISTGVMAGASGDADFELRSDRIDFSVEIEDVPPGSYRLEVGGIDRGEINVASTPSGNEGEIEFRSPASPGKILLDFDPRGQTIDVLGGGDIILTSVAPDSGSIPGGGDGAPPFGDSEIDVDLTNEGVFPAGDADAELEQESNRVDFKVEVEDVPVGSYALVVDGIERGQIQVVADDNGTEGELEFRFPTESGKLPLDFDPRGALVEVFDGNTRLFWTSFPASGVGDDGGDGDGDGGGSPDSEIEIDLTNAGVYPAGSGDAEYDVDADGTDFDVEIEDVPAGSYTLRVGGTVRGTIQVVDDEGEIEFGNPPDDDELPLDFDPRGQLIEVLEGGTLIFSGNFPS